MKIINFKMNFKILFLCFFLFVVVPWGGPADAAMNENDSALDVEIHLQKTTFASGEPIGGTVTVENKYPASFSAIFDIRLIHDGKLVNEFSTSIDRIPSGKTHFPFRAFGIPHFNSDETALGTWQISILQQNLDISHTKVISIQIVPPEKSKDKADP